MRILLEQLGFRLEGILRAFGTLSDGTRPDGALYAVVKPDWVDRLGVPTSN
jgi:RimJ/RimL family protein N-acetyltransferase